MAFSNNPFERLTFCGIYSRSMALLMERLDLFMVIALIMYIPYLLIQFSFPTTIADLDPTTDDLTNPETNPFLANDPDGNPTKVVMKPLVTLYGELIFSAAIGIIGQAAIVLASAHMYLHGQPTIRTCCTNAIGKFCTLFCGRFIITLAITVILVVCTMFAFFLFFVESIVCQLLALVVGLVGVGAYFYIAIAMTLYIPAVMIEGLDAMEALRRSLELVSREFCLVLCTTFCFSLIMLVVNSIVTWFTMDGMLGTAMAKITFLFQFPLSTLIAVVVYFHIRVTHEGLNRDVLARELNNGGSALSRGGGGHNYDHVMAMEVVEAEAIAIVEKV